MVAPSGVLTRAQASSQDASEPSGKKGRQLSPVSGTVKRPRSSFSAHAPLDTAGLALWQEEIALYSVCMFKCECGRLLHLSLTMALLLVLVMSFIFIFYLFRLV